MLGVLISYRRKCSSLTSSQPGVDASKRLPGCCWNLGCKCLVISIYGRFMRNRKQDHHTIEINHMSVHIPSEGYPRYICSHGPTCLPKKLPQVVAWRPWPPAALWHGLRHPLVPGTQVQVPPGCVHPTSGWGQGGDQP